MCVVGEPQKYRQEAYEVRGPAELPDSDLCAASKTVGVGPIQGRTNHERLSSEA